LWAASFGQLELSARLAAFQVELGATNLANAKRASALVRMARDKPTEQLASLRFICANVNQLFHLAT